MENSNIKILHYVNISWAIIMLAWFLYKLSGILLPAISKDILDYLFWVGVFSLATIIGFYINQKAVRNNLDKVKATIYYDWAWEIRLSISLLSTTLFLFYVVWQFKL